MTRRGVKIGYPQRPFSRYDCQDDKFGSTIAVRPYYELCVVLNNELRLIKQKTISRHNAELALLFRSEVSAIGYRVLPRGQCDNGIIGVAFGSEEECQSLIKALKEAGYICAPSAIPLQIQDSRMYVLRVSFQFYHDAHDVYELITLFSDAWREQEIARGSRGYQLSE